MTPVQITAYTATSCLGQGLTAQQLQHAAFPGCASRQQQTPLITGKAQIQYLLRFNRDLSLQCQHWPGTDLQAGL